MVDALSWDAAGVWSAVYLYCCDIGNNGQLLKDDLPAAVARKISGKKLESAVAELLRRPETGFSDGGAHWVLDWSDQPKSEVWNNDTLRERWARDKQLSRDRELCSKIKNRDRNLCRYCGVRVNWTDKRGRDRGTYDHVDPDLGNTELNVVVACGYCNSNLKKDRTPDQAGMPLLKPGVTEHDLIGRHGDVSLLAASAKGGSVQHGTGWLDYIPLGSTTDPDRDLTGSNSGPDIPRTPARPRTDPNRAKSGPNRAKSELTGTRQPSSPGHHTDPTLTDAALQDF